MKRYYDTVASKQSGLPVARAEVRVYVQASDGSQGAPAGLFANTNGTGPLTQPVYTDTNGLYSFCVADGTYQIVVSGASLTPLTFRDIQIFEADQDVARALRVPDGEIAPPLLLGPAPANKILALDPTGSSVIAIDSPSVGVVDSLGSSATQAASQRATSNGIAGKFNSTGGDISGPVGIRTAGSQELRMSSLGGAAQWRAISGANGATLGTFTIQGSLDGFVSSFINAATFGSDGRLGLLALSIGGVALEGGSGAGLVGYQPPGSGSPGRTAAAKFGELVSLKDFGATCLPGSDDTAAWQRFRDYVNASAYGVSVYINPGISVCNARIVFTKSVTLFGAGETISAVRLGTNAGIAANYANDGDYGFPQIKAHGFSLQANGANATYPAIEVVQTANTGGTGNQATFRDLGFSGKDGSSGFAKCIRLEGCSNVLIDHVRVVGDRDVAPANKVVVTAIDVMTPAGADKAELTISNSYFYFYPKVAQVRGHFEGVTVFRNTAVACLDGIDWQADSDQVEPLLAFSHNHFNCERSQVYCVGIAQADVSHNNFYNNNFTGLWTGNYTGVTLVARLGQGLQGKIIANDWFVSSTASSVAEMICISLDSTDGTLANMIIDANQFRTVGFTKTCTAIILGNLTIGAIVGPTNYVDGIVNIVINSGVNNMIQIMGWIYASASLPSASSWPGMKITVKDVASPVFGAVLSSGGSSTVPAYSDGTNWRVG